MRRFVHPSGWYADVPDEAHARLGARSTISVVDADAPPPARPHVRMRGTVLSAHPEWTLVSCHGLLVGLPHVARVGEAVTLVLTV